MFERFRNKKTIKDAAISNETPEEDGQSPSDKLLSMTLAGLKDERGVHVETALAYLGGLAGFSTQMALRKVAEFREDLNVNELLTEIKTVDGQIYYTGEILFDPLFRTTQGHTSVYLMAAEGVHSLGVQEFPPIKDIIEYTAASLGEDCFGKPRVPDKHQPHFPVTDMLKDSWDIISLFLEIHDGGNPTIWPFLIGASIKSLILQAEGAISPEFIMPIVMDTANAMSKMNPQAIVAQSASLNDRIIHLDRTELGKLLASQEFRSAFDASKRQTTK